MGMLRNIINAEIDIEVMSSDKNNPTLFNKGHVIQFIQEQDKKNKKELIKNQNNDDVKTPLDEYYYDNMPVPQIYSMDALPVKVYDYAFNSEDGKYTLGITCFGKQSIAGYELDVCEIVHINNSTNKVRVLENVMGALDRKMLREKHPYHKAYAKILIEKMFAEDRLDKILAQYKGHFGIVKFNPERKVFQLCTITPVVQKLDEIFSLDTSMKNAIQLAKTSETIKPKREWKRLN